MCVCLGATAKCHLMERLLNSWARSKPKKVTKNIRPGKGLLWPQGGLKQFDGLLLLHSAITVPISRHLPLMSNLYFKFSWISPRKKVTLLIKEVIFLFQVVIRSGCTGGTYSLIPHSGELTWRILSTYSSPYNKISYVLKSSFSLSLVTNLSYLINPPFE